jgi:hypothetical protein
MELDAVLRWLYATPIATTIRENESLFPWIESFHVLAITLVIGTIAIVDLRLLGLAWRDRAFRPLTRDVLPCTWAAFALAAVTGGVLFASNAYNYAHNFFFQGKLLLLALAGLNMLLFQLLVSPGIERAETPSPMPAAAKIAGAVSLVLWVAVVGFGRWIGFTLQPTLAG